MKRIPPTKEQIRLFALIAYREGEISEERCCEITGISREDLRSEMERRVGLSRPFTELTNEVERLTEELRVTKQYVLMDREGKKMTQGALNALMSGYYSLLETKLSLKDRVRQLEAALRGGEPMHACDHCRDLRKASGNTVCPECMVGTVHQMVMVNAERAAAALAEAGGEVQQ